MDICRVILEWSRVQISMEADQMGVEVIRAGNRRGVCDEWDDGV
jgi:hypothetical protein